MRVSIGAFVPGLILLIIMNRPIEGLSAAVSAIFVGLVDLPGSPANRCRDMSVGALINIISAGLIAWSHHNPWLLSVAVLLISTSGAYAMNFGLKAGIIGLNSVLTMTLALSLNNRGLGLEQPYLAGSLIGAIWYIPFSLLFCTVFRHQMHRRALADLLYAAAGQFRARASSYDPGVDELTSRNRQLASQNVWQQHLLLSRTLILGELSGLRHGSPSKEQIRLYNLIVDAAGFLDLINAANTDFHLIRQYPACNPLLLAIRDSLNHSAGAMERIAASISLGRKVGRTRLPSLKLELVQSQWQALAPQLPQQISNMLQASIQRMQRIRQLIAKLMRDTHSTRNTSGLALQNVLDYYQAPPPLFSRPRNWFCGPAVAYAVRLSLAILLALAASRWRHEGHNNWIVMTVAIAMRPGFGLSWQRGIKRAQGTVLGCTAAVLLLLLVHDVYALVFLLFTGLLLSLALATMDYLASAFFTSITLVIVYHLLSPQSAVIGDRITDTLIGAIIALGMAHVFPYWESRQIKSNCQAVIKALTAYLGQLRILQPCSQVAYRAAQREAYTAIMQLGTSRDNMMLEPAKTRLASQAVNTLLLLAHQLMESGSLRAEQRLQNDSPTPGRDVEQALAILHDHTSLPANFSPPLQPGLAEICLHLAATYQEIKHGKRAEILNS